MPRRDASTAPWEEGTASVELVAVVPCLLLAVLVAAQLAVAGHSLWSAGVAARAGARAALVGGEPERTARRALPAPLREGAEVDGPSPVFVRVAVPRLLPALPDLTVRAGARLESGDG